MKSKRRAKSIIRSRRGAAIVEMAIAMMLLLLLVFGMIDVGLMLRDSLALHQVAREAARSRALGSSDEWVTAKAKDWAEKLALDESRLTITIGEADTQHVSVDVGYPHTTITGSFVGLADVVNLHATAVMRKE